MHYFCLLSSLPGQAAPATAGDPVAGQAAYAGRMCTNCHGPKGEGGFGPDLAGGRGLTFEQVRHAVRKPWGVMVAYTEQQLPDSAVMDIFAFLKTLPKVEKPGGWHWIAAPRDAALGQRLHMQTVGCGQCHEPENRFVRGLLGGNAKEMTYEYFSRLVYQHTDKYPTGRMGNYSPDRLSELVLKQIYTWLVDDLGMRPNIGGTIAVGQREGDATTFNVAARNLGVKDKGLAAEKVTVYVKVPQGMKVTGSTGAGYQGVAPFSSLGLAPALMLAPHPHDASAVVEWPKVDLSFNVAVWRVPRLAAGDVFNASLRMAGALTPEVLREFDSSAIYWDSPGRRPAGRPPVMPYRDLRSPDTGDHQRFTLPTMPSESR